MTEAFEKGAVRVAAASKALHFEFKAPDDATRVLIRDYILLHGKSRDYFHFNTLDSGFDVESFRNKDEAIEWLENPRQMRVVGQKAQPQPARCARPHKRWATDLSLPRRVLDSGGACKQKHFRLPRRRNRRDGLAHRHSNYS